MNHILGAIEIFMGKIAAVLAKNRKKKKKKKRKKGKGMASIKMFRRVTGIYFFETVFCIVQSWTACPLRKSLQCVYVKSKLASIYWYMSCIASFH